MKYDDETTAKELSGVEDYPAINRTAVREMYRQVGDLQVDSCGVAQRGLLVRHLVLPHGLAGTSGIADFLSKEISTNTYLNIMAQYRPCYRASEIPGLARPISAEEYQEALWLAERAGLVRLDGRYTVGSVRLRRE